MNNIKVVCGHCGKGTEVTPVMYEHAESACMKFLCEECSGIGDPVIVSDAELMSYDNKPISPGYLLRMKSEEIELSDKIEKAYRKIAREELDPVEQELLQTQYYSMKAYKQTLHLRIQYAEEKIKECGTC